MTVEPIWVSHRSHRRDRFRDRLRLLIRRARNNLVKGCRGWSWKVKMGRGREGVMRKKMGRKRKEGVWEVEMGMGTGMDICTIAPS